MQEKFWYLKRCDLFERLDAEEIEALESRCLMRTFARKSLIYLPSDQSDSVLLLASGRVKLYHITHDGKEAVLALIEPGELFGELALVEPGQREEFAEAMIPSRVVLIPGEAVRELMEKHPEVSLEVTRLMGLRRRRTERRLKSLLFRSNRERLIHLLLELAEKYGRATSDGLLIDIKLSHQELASIIGSTRETVTVVLGELQAEGYLLIQRRQVILRNLEGLAASLGVSPPRVGRSGGDDLSPSRFL
ncbi:MAG: Crp/Fnr family transcriptional regulator [Planctomycetes bacterium]|nr:Crp/Fnr family transcriptional regulator [Planctomycetota bacterium]